MRDTPLILQSSFKGNHPSYLEEIQRDTRVCLENTKHVVLLGYRLPQDDVIYRAMLSARRARSQPPAYGSVVVGRKGPAHWLKGSELMKHVDTYRHHCDFGAETIQAAIDIFGEGRVRAYTAGIPRVFGTPPGPEGVFDPLYSVGVGIVCFTPNGVCRGPDE